MSEMLRPKDAAARFSVSRYTLATWADKGLIGRSQVGNCVWYASQDIADLIAANTTPRTVVPMKEPTPAPQDDWRKLGFWAGAAGVQR